MKKINILCIIFSIHRLMVTKGKRQTKLNSMSKNKCLKANYQKTNCNVHYVLTIYLDAIKWRKKCNECDFNDIQNIMYKISM